MPHLPFLLANCRLFTPLKARGQRRHDMMEAALVQNKLSSRALLHPVLHLTKYNQNSSVTKKGTKNEVCSTCDRVEN